MTVKKPLPVRPLSPAETRLVKHIDTHWTRDYALSQLHAGLQTAVEIELATLPIYLFTYYSINRTPTGFPGTGLSRFADQAGGVVMSVAVEEMLHMSLTSNILFSLGVLPQLYLRSPGPYPTDLPGHGRLGPDHKPMSLPLARFSSAQLWKFLEIEYPAVADAPPEEHNWKTIGQIYSFARCIISSRHLTDDDFRKGAELRQIQPGNYSPNNIDTVFPRQGFNFTQPVPAPVDGSAATVAVYPSRGDSHSGGHELMTVSSRHEAMQAIQTIDAQGEGFGPEKVDDESDKEFSHYYKFLRLQSHIAGYDPRDEKLPKLPAPPAAPPRDQQFDDAQLAQVIIDFPDNPVAAAYPPGRREVADVASGLYQYMLIMTESIFLNPPAEQKLYFNKALHRSMIWILDKVVRAMRQIPVNAAEPDGPFLAPTFENINLGARSQAFANLVAMCKALDDQYGTQSWYASDLKYYIDMIPTLPDVSNLWPARPPVGAAATQYRGIPKFPAAPPAPGQLQHDEVRHACMGLNHCKGQGRTRDNACAGQGYCSTALEFNYADPSAPVVSDHTCHVKNACAGQGGCGLYGTAEEQDHPGGNACGALGSCATPINAERFSTCGPNRGKSVWVRARERFTEKTWPALRAKNPALPAHPPLPAGELFRYGPTIEWIHDYSGQGMTACGSSGMSGAGSCA